MTWHRIGNLVGAKGADGRDASAPDYDGIIARLAGLIPTPKDGRDGRDGVSVSVDEVTAMVARLVTAAVAALPTPRDGKDADPVDLDAIAQRAADLVPRPEMTPETVKAIVDDAVLAAVALVPVPSDGKDADPELLRAEIAKAVGALPVPRNGADGKDGLSVTVDDVAPLVAAEVAKAVGAIALPKDGTGISEAVIDHEGVLILTMSDGRMKAVGKVIGQPGRDGMPGVPGRTAEDGKPGQDGMGFDDIQVEHDGERGFAFKFVRGDRVKTFGGFVIPTMIDRGVWKDGDAYERGDAVSWGGSLFIAQRATSVKPETNSDWRLAVKRGRDGKQGADGKQGPQGPKGEKAWPDR